MMMNVIFDEILIVIGFIIQPHYWSNAKLAKNGNIVMRSKGSILNCIAYTPYLSIGFYEGELKAINFFGMIQFRSPFYTLS